MRMQRKNEQLSGTLIILVKCTFIRGCTGLHHWNNSRLQYTSMLHWSTDTNSNAVCGDFKNNLWRKIFYQRVKCRFWSALKSAFYTYEHPQICTSAFYPGPQGLQVRLPVSVATASNILANTQTPRELTVTFLHFASSWSVWTMQPVWFLPERDYITFGSLLSQFRLSVCLSSVVCNAGAPYSGGWSFPQNFFTAVYAGHPVTSVQNFTEIVLGAPLHQER